MAPPRATGTFTCPDTLNGTDDSSISAQGHFPVRNARALSQGGSESRADENSSDAYPSVSLSATAPPPTNPTDTDPFSYPSVSTSHTNPSPTLLPSFSPPGDSSGSSSTSVNSPQTPPVAGAGHVDPPYILQDYADPLMPDASSCFSTAQKSDPTLAPSLVHGQRNFTQDEILASEVLEDLLRSPQYSRQNSSSLETSSYLSLASPSAPSNARPWHGAVAAKNDGNEAVQVMGNWDGDPLDQEEGYNGIEFSPEAQALASYFNAGGVGGISALDLGFTPNPSLYPDHLFEPNLPDMDDQKFFLPSQRFCVGYLYPWSVPPIKTLSRFAKIAATSFLPSIPVVHPASMVMRDLPTHTAFALTVTGASYDSEGESFSNEMLVEKRVFLVRGFNKEGNSDDDKFSSLQSMLLYQLLGLFHKDEQRAPPTSDPASPSGLSYSHKLLPTERLLSHTFHGALVMMLRQLALPTKIREAPPINVHAGLSGEALEETWKAWVRVETWRRVTCIVYLADIETAAQFETAPLLPFAELAIDLPSSDALWNAKTSSLWLLQYLTSSSLSSSGVPFLDAIRALLAPTTPAPCTRDDLILSRLPSLSSFPLLILSRTLSFLEMKTRETIRQTDPFRALLGGVGVFEGKEQENQDVLRRILNGREVLKRIPGGAKRGGGEKWYEGVIPTTKGPFEGTKRVREEDEDEDDFVLPTNFKQPSPSPCHIKRAAAGVRQAWPDFMA